MAENIIVAIGASAGGLEALSEFMAALSTDATLSVIVAQHLAPHNSSVLTQLISRQTSLQVHTLEADVTPAPGTIYITPPNSDVILENGVIRLVKASEKVGPKPSINRLFHSIAKEAERDDPDTRYVAAVFSGTGSDGSEYLAELREAGVIVVVQDPESARYNGMPFAAIHKNQYDLVVTTDRFGELLSMGDLSLLKESGGGRDFRDSQILRSITDTVHQETGIDFSDYKRSTTERRVKRRMSALGVKTYEDYFEFMSINDDEPHALQQELLVPVTEFFRDFQAFEVLRKHLLTYLQQMDPGSTFRVWCVGCSSGQEAYSLAILANELIETNSMQLGVQIFATDLDEKALAEARRAEYDVREISGIPSQVVNRCFVYRDGVYQVKDTLRDMVTFSKHGLGTDAPFSRIDLLSCRNLMIYYNATSQATFSRIFRYSLNRGGLLFLGQAEALGEESGFETLDLRAKVFCRSMNANYYSGLSMTLPNFRTPVPGEHTRKLPPKESTPLADPTLNLLNVLFQKSFIGVTDKRKLAYISEKLRHIFKLRTGLVGGTIDDFFDSEIADAMKASVSSVSKQHVRMNIVPIEMPDPDTGEVRRYYTQAFSVPRNNLGMTVAIVFIEGHTDDGDVSMSDAHHEIIYLKEALHNAVQELEQANEALQLANEELQSSNEELQSSNEELQTTNEELQSTNEELLTVNDEVLAKSAILNTAQQTLTALRSVMAGDVLVLSQNGEILFGQSSGCAISNKTGALDGLKFSDLRWIIDVGEVTNILFGPASWSGDAITLTLGEDDNQCSVVLAAEKQSGSQLISVSFTPISSS